MTEERFQRIERLIADAGRCFYPLTSRFEAVSDEEDFATDLEPAVFLDLLGITEDECTEYVQRKQRDLDESFPDA